MKIHKINKRKYKTKRIIFGPFFFGQKKISCAFLHPYFPASSIFFGIPSNELINSEFLLILLFLYNSRIVFPPDGQGFLYDGSISDDSQSIKFLAY